ETADTEIYTRLKLPMAWRVFYSGIVGGLFDSVVFVIVGLSPLGAGFLPWEAVPAAIVGQVIVKTIIQMIGALILNQIHSVKEKDMLSA
ncbi:VUT family protein, partial [Butyricicoccus sp. 1XD8-22]